MSKDTDSVYIPKDAFIELTYTVNGSNSKYCGPYLSGDCDTQIDYSSRGSFYFQILNLNNEVVYKSETKNYSRNSQKISDKFNLSGKINEDGYYKLRFIYTYAAYEIGSSGDCCGSSSTGSPNVTAIVSDIKISK